MFFVENYFNRETFSKPYLKKSQIYLKSRIFSIQSLPKIKSFDVQTVDCQGEGHEWTEMGEGPN